MTQACRTERTGSETTAEHAGTTSGKLLGARKRGLRSTALGMPDALLGALDHVDIGIWLLDVSMRTVFMNQPFRTIWAIPDEVVEQRPTFREITRHLEAMQWCDMPAAERRIHMRRQEQSIRDGSVPPTQIDLPGGRHVRFRCDALADGGRILTYVDVTEDVRRGAETAMERIGAELRFATETLESQAAYLVTLAEETEETRKQADMSRIMLEREIEDRRNIEAQLRHVATTDGLTGVLNRAAFLNRAERELNRAQRSGNPLSILMLDADHFKTVNDRYGHAGGDTVLKHLASTCRSTMRAGECIGRLGGEEFAIVLPGAVLETARQVAERLRISIAERGVWFGGANIFITVSIGIGALRQADQSIEQVMARADAALYAAKKAGRNQIALEAAA